MAKFSSLKQLREMQNQVQELQEDLEAEKLARDRADKLKTDLNEVIQKY